MIDDAELGAALRRLILVSERLGHAELSNTLTYVHGPFADPMEVVLAVVRGESGQEIAERFDLGPLDLDLGIT